LSTPSHLHAWSIDLTPPAAFAWSDVLRRIAGSVIYKTIRQCMAKQPPTCFFLSLYPFLSIVPSAHQHIPPWMCCYPLDSSRPALKTQVLCSKVSNKQAVFLKTGASSGTVWQFQKTTHGKDGRVDRILGVGSPVFAGIEVCRLLLSIVHGSCVVTAAVAAGLCFFCASVIANVSCLW